MELFGQISRTARSVLSGKETYQSVVQSCQTKLVETEEASVLLVEDCLILVR